MLYHCLNHTPCGIIPIAYEYTVLLLICSTLYSQLFTIELSVVSMHQLSMVSDGDGSQAPHREAHCLKKYAYMCMQRSKVST